MADVERKGYLIDWDLACPAEKAANDCNPPYSVSYICMTRICVPLIITLLVRKAAWAVTSAEIAKGHTPKPYGVKYDMESLLYVVLYDAILYLRHNQDAYVVRRTISHIFDFQGSESGEPMGGVGKEHNVTQTRYTRDYHWNSVLDNWLDTMMNYMFPLRVEYIDRFPRTHKGLSGAEKPSALAELPTGGHDRLKFNCNHLPRSVQSYPRHHV